MVDFAMLADAWLTTSEDAGWNAACDVFTDNHVDMRDLSEFVEAWRNTLGL